MEKDLDKKLYNDYLDGQKEAFEFLYNKYKKRIEYFIFNIVKDYQKAEDLTQETFIYVMQNKIKENISFKYYIYMVAKSRAINHIKIEKRRTEITEEYLYNYTENIEKDVLEFITKEETKKEVIEAIELLDEKYKNAIYLVKIEELSYEETSKILGQTLQNTKNLIHRGKKQLRKILLKKGFDDMNKILKVVIIILCITVSLTGITFAGVTIYNTFIKKQDKIETRGLFDDGRGYTDYETDLMANDMTWQDDVRLYYRIITNSDDYEKYKSRISTFPEVSEINFDENFIVIIANENYRDFDEIDMEISNVYVDETTTNIIMKQKENPNMNDTTNVWYVIVDNSQLKDNVKIAIEHKKFSNENIIEISKLPLDYSVNTAIEDDCFTLKNNKVVSSNENQLDEFIEKTKKGENSFIRIYSNYEGEITIIDVNFENGIYYTDTIVLETEKKYHNTYKGLEKKEVRNGVYTDIEYVLYGGRNDTGNGGVPLVIIQNWLEDYKNTHN
ncbi:MAG: RNA polymerase sigma factor [Bacilli bacterium]